MTQITRCVAAHGVDKVVFSPDGKSVAITSSVFRGTLQLFDIDSGTARWKHGGFGSSLTEVSFSADGSLLAVAGDRATVLDAADGHVVMRRRVRGGGDSPLRTLISPDGTSLTTVRGREVRVHDVRSAAARLYFNLDGRYGVRTQLARLPDCRCVRYSPDGTRVAALVRGGIHVWDAASFQLQARLHVPAKTYQMQFGGCSHVLVTAARNDSIIRVWDFASGTLTGLCDTAPGTTRLRLGDGSGRVALTSCTDGTLRVWDVTTGQERTRLPTPQRFRVGAVNSDATKAGRKQRREVR